MNNDEYYEYESRAYVNPTLSSGEQEEFISNLRDVQSQGNAQIAQQTYNLGTDVPSNLGGLGGGESYFMSRYQTPQVDEMISTLETAAKAQELQDLMNNYKAQLNNRYKQAYRNYQRRQRARSRGSGGTTTPAPSTSTTKGKVNETVANTGKATAEGLYQEMLKHQDAQANTKKAKEEAAERAKRVSQAVNPQVDIILNQQDAIDYWKNIRR